MRWTLVDMRWSFVTEPTYPWSVKKPREGGTWDRRGEHVPRVLELVTSCRSVHPFSIVSVEQSHIAHDSALTLHPQVVSRDKVDARQIVPCCQQRNDQHVFLAKSLGTLANAIRT